MTPFAAQGRHVVVTGGGSGIGAALARRFATCGAARVVVADIDPDAARAVATAIGGEAMGCDVGDPQALAGLVDAVQAGGPIDLFCSNAGVTARGGAEVPRAAWQTLWDINVMAHVEAARLLLPGMLARGQGHFLNVASAAGLLSQFDAPYAVTKHAAVAFAEWLAITYAHRGIGVSCLCPGGVDTPLLRSESAARQAALGEGQQSADQVAETAIRGLEEGRFLILTHGFTQEQMRRRAADPDRWVRGMGRFHAGVADAEGGR